MKKTFGKIVLVYYLIYFVAIAAMALGYLILKNGVAIDVTSEAGITLQSLIIMYIMASVPFALYFFNKMTKKWQLIENEEEKLKVYAKWAIIRLLAVGLGLFAGIIFYYLMRSQSMLFCAGIAAIGLFFCKPAKSKIENELNLNNEQLTE